MTAPTLRPRRPSAPCGSSREGTLNQWRREMADKPARRSTFLLIALPDSLVLPLSMARGPRLRPLTPPSRLASAWVVCNLHEKHSKG
eukprot:scaffold58481_cov31-Tisochrysis_lutea.AAC.2